MRITSLFAILVLVPTASFASLPEDMSEALAAAKESYLSYSKKSADEILDHRYDDTEVSLLSQIDFAEMYDDSHTPAETLEYRFQTVKDLAWAFTRDQLRALPDVIRESAKEFSNDKRSVARNTLYVDLALRLKKSDIKETALRELLNQKPFVE